jgi:prepilin-type processing-associated H-X9-DG protein
LNCNSGKNNNTTRVIKKTISAARPSTVYVFGEENQISIDNGAMGTESREGPAQFWNPPSGRHSDGAHFSFLDGHAELFRWRGPKLAPLNRANNSDDTVAQRGSSTVNPLNPSPTTATDVDYLRLADALPTL